jgi:anti-sigma regulatory factor (Ser/Thr protein kinase)
MAALAMSRRLHPPAGSPVIQLFMVGRLEQVSHVVERVESFGAAHGLSSRVLHDLQVTLDEVLSNIVKHAYSDARDHRIRVRVWIVPSSQVVAEVTDDGRPFDPLATPRPPRKSARERALTGGLGIYFLRSLVDELHYERAGRTNRLVMRKALGAQLE